MELVVGVKSSAKELTARDALRRTWLRDARASGVCVWFIVGRPNTDPAASPVEVGRALAEEQRIYGDLVMAPDIDVEDSYFGLVGKTKQFMRFATRYQLNRTSSYKHAALGSQ